MRFLSIVKKNFMILLRSKSSAFIVFIGPILIIALVGLVFSGKTSYDLSVGYYAPEKTNLTNSFISSLQESNYLVHEYFSEDLCAEKIKQGVIHTCIVFPPGFEVGNDNANELRFLVDYSRINLVYKVIESVSGIIDFRSREVSYSLTSILLSRINDTIKDMDFEANVMDALSESQLGLKSEFDKISENAGLLKFDSGFLDFSEVNSELNLTRIGIAESFNKSGEVVNRAYALIDELDEYLNASEISSKEESLADLNEELELLQNSTIDRIDEASYELSILHSSFERLKNDLDNSRKLNDDTKIRLEIAKLQISQLKERLASLRARISSSQENLKGISVNKAEAIVSPVSTRIEPVSSGASNMDFTFPFLLVLIIMFVAMLLSSTLIIFERNSKAFFRNFMAPVGRRLLIFSSFFTVILIILIQAFVILVLSQLFLKLQILSNPFTTAIVILVASVFFTVIGMIIGYSFSSQEGAVMGSLVIGSTFLFVSNMVVPLESISSGFTSIIRYNPFIMFSELLRRSMLFGLSIKEASKDLSVLLGIALLGLIIMLFLKGKARKSRMKKAPAKTEGKNNEKLWSLKIGTKQVQNHEQLLQAISYSTKAEYEELVSPRENRIADWVEESLQDKGLASRLRKAESKDDAISLLKADLKRHAAKDDDGDARE